MSLDLDIGTVKNAELAGRLILGGWASNDKLAALGHKVLKRDQYRCRGCGFQSRASKQVPSGYMVPVWVDHPGLLPLDVDRSVCLCPVCASSLSINWSVDPRGEKGKAPRAPGMLIYCPWLSQAQVSLLGLHAISINASRKIGQSSALDAAARDFDASVQGLNHSLGATLPIYRGKDSEFARALAMLPEPLYEQRAQLIKHVRFWPALAYWETQGAYWMQASFAPVHREYAALLEDL